MTDRRTLICDDEKSMTEYFEKVCVGMGHSVRVLNDPGLFAPALREFDPTDIILDIVMPDIDGFELLNDAVKAGFHGRLVIVSGYNPQYGAMAKELGQLHGIAAVAFLQKPFGIAELRRALSQEIPSPV